MAEAISTIEATDPSPRHFVAFGRLIGGLLISTVGGFGLHYSNNPEINTFACVATVSGVVLNLWGFAGTVLHPKATAEDCFWATSFLLLFCGVLAGNIYYNSLDYGVLAPGLEVAMAFAILVLAWMVAVVTQILNLKNSALSKQEHRRRMLIAGVVTILALWTFGRPLVCANYHIMKLAESSVTADGYLNFEPKHYSGIRDLPRWSVRWVVLSELKSSEPRRIQNCTRLLRGSQYLMSFLSSDEQLRFKVK